MVHVKRRWGEKARGREGEGVKAQGEQQEQGDEKR
jgi:hypothetical protein